MQLRAHDVLSLSVPLEQLPYGMPAYLAQQKNSPQQEENYLTALMQQQVGLQNMMEQPSDILAIAIPIESVIPSARVDPEWRQYFTRQ